MAARLGLLFGVALLICAGGVLLFAPGGDATVVRLRPMRGEFLPFEISMVREQPAVAPVPQTRQVDGIELPLYEPAGAGPKAPVEPSGEARMTGTFAELFKRGHVALGFLAGLWCCFIAFVRNPFERQLGLAGIGLLLLIGGALECYFYFWTHDWPTLIVPLLQVMSGYCCFLSVPFARVGALLYGLIRGIAAILLGSYIEISAVSGPSWIRAMSGAQNLLWPVVIIWFFSLPWVREHFRAGATA